MELAVPEEVEGLLLPGPVGVALKASHQGCPCRRPLLAGVPRMGVNPMLEGINRGNPGEPREDLFKVVPPGAGRGLRGVKCTHLLVAQQLHAHRGHLADFHGRIAVGQEVHFHDGEGVEGVSRLMQ